VYDIGYVAQTRLLLQCLPLVEQHACFALKGGTALNLFVQELPRVSVDIDLTYTPLKPRDEALAEISDELLALADNLKTRIPQITIHQQHVQGALARLTIAAPGATIKIEPNLVFRGSVYPPESRDLCAAAQERFETFVRVRCLSEADLYGGKLTAALDRQHPRDLFDVKLLLDGGGITAKIRRAFVVYLAGHNRPMNELLNPNLKDITETFQAQFVGMTEEKASLESLVDIQHRLPRMLVSNLDDDERAFLLAMKHGKPEWDRLGFDHLDQLPALQWKLRNIQQMDSTKHQESLDRLQRILEPKIGLST